MSRRGIVFVGKTWTTKPEPGVQQYELQEWLQLPAYFVDTTNDLRSREQLIKHISNKEGGCHYDEEIAPAVDVLNRASVSMGNDEFDGIQMFLLDMAALVFWAGRRMGCVWASRQVGINVDLETDQKIKEKIIRLDDEFERIIIGVPTMMVEVHFDE